MNAFVGKFDAPAVQLLTQNAQGSWISVDLGEDFLLEVNQYSLRHGYSSGADKLYNILHNWDLQAQASDGSWVTLKEHRNDTSMQNAPGSGWAKMASWPVQAKSKSYRIFRIVTTGLNRISKGHSNWKLACAGIELYGNLKQSSSP